MRNIILDPLYLSLFSGRYCTRYAPSENEKYLIRTYTINFEISILFAYSFQLGFLNSLLRSFIVLILRDTSFYIPFNDFSVAAVCKIQTHEVGKNPGIRFYDTKNF